MSSETPRGIIVGIDSPETSQRALAWACAEAEGSGRALHLLHVHPVPTMYGTFDAYVVEADFHFLQEIADSTVAAALASAQSQVSHVRVSASAVVGCAAAVLVEYSEAASMIVLGSRGRSPMTRALLGSVSTQVAMHANCPVVVLRGAAAEDARMTTGGNEAVINTIVVGVDGPGAGADAVLEFAFEKAQQRGVGLEIVHTWTDRPGQLTAVQEPRVVERELASRSESFLAETVLPWAQKYPDVRVQRASVEGDPVAILLQRSGHAQLLVVGSRGRGGFTGLLLGSVSHAVLQQADCPVAVVRPHRH